MPVHTHHFNLLICTLSVLNCASTNLVQLPKDSISLPSTEKLIKRSQSSLHRLGDILYEFYDSGVMRDIREETEHNWFVFTLGMLWRSFNTGSVHPANKLFRTKTMYKESFVLILPIPVQTRFLKIYFQIYKQDACDVTLSVYPHRASLKNMDVGKFALNFRLTCRLSKNWPTELSI